MCVTPGGVWRNMFTLCWRGAVLLEKADAVCFCGSVELRWGFVLFWFLFGMFLGGAGGSQLYFK